MIQMLKNQWWLLCVALQFFTRIPVPAIPNFSNNMLNASARYFPLVGILVGAISALALWLAAFIFPMPIAALIAMATSMLVTGAFHEDGLADTFDALGGAVSRERAMVIMKDSRLGAYGAAALFISQLLRWQALAFLPLPIGILVLLASHAAARAAAISLMASLPYVRDTDESKTKPIAQELSGLSLALVVLFGITPLVIFSVFFSGSWIIMLSGFLALICIRFYCVHWFKKRLGGYTGDTLGCTEQMGEIIFLLAACAVLHLNLQLQ
jgi:adenosylcobinamide-GDP ribazoletransferase